jgi:hypothetical protein
MEKLTRDGITKVSDYKLSARFLRISVNKLNINDCGAAAMEVAHLNNNS